MILSSMAFYSALHYLLFPTIQAYKQLAKHLEWKCKWAGRACLLQWTQNIRKFKHNKEQYGYFS